MDGRGYGARHNFSIAQTCRRDRTTAPWQAIRMAKSYELPAEIAHAVRSGERVTATGDGVPLAAIVPIEELRRLEALAAAQERRGREKALLDEAQQRSLSIEANRTVLTELAKR